MPLDHPPGEAQVDFGEVVFCEKGQRITGYELVMSFPYSNGGYPQLLKGQNQECLFTGMIDIFEHMEKVPKVIWFDNLSAAVAGINGQGNLLRGSSVSVCTMDLKQGSATRTAGTRNAMSKTRWDIAAGTFLYLNRSLMK